MGNTKLASIKEILNELKLPATTSFLGFVAHYPGQDEFLSRIVEGNNHSATMFCKTPELAKRFGDYRQAQHAAAKTTNQGEAYILLDSGDNYLIYPVREFIVDLAS